MFDREKKGKWEKYSGRGERTRLRRRRREGIARWSLSALKDFSYSFRLSFTGSSSSDREVQRWPARCAERGTADKKGEAKRRRKERDMANQWTNGECVRASDARREREIVLPLLTADRCFIEITGRREIGRQTAKFRTAV